METDLGKLFIGGISWDTDEERLKEYFSNYGEVVEAVIMRDRATGRARGFGFVVFTDPVIAERVIMDKHMIDGRTVEAKKAVPRDDQNMLNRNTSSLHSSPGPGRTKKIFVGGLASTVTESDFKNYFDQFGTISDVVVMYDHSTQRPRGFGFITYDSEEAVDRVLHRTFHELNGKMVEVKRAVPKELSPGPNRSPVIGYNNLGLSRCTNLLNSFAQRYSFSTVGGFGVRMDGRFSPVAADRGSVSPFNGAGYGIGMNLDGGLSPSYGGASNFVNGLGYGRMLSPYPSGSSNRFSTPIDYVGGSGRGDSLLSSTTWNVWGNGGVNSSINSASPGAFLGSGSGNLGVPFGNRSANWGWDSAPGVSASGYSSGSVGYASGEGNYGIGRGSFRRTSSAGVGPTASFAEPTGDYEGSFGDLYRSQSVYRDSTWQTPTPKLDGSGGFSYGFGTMSPDVSAKSSEGIIGSFNIISRQPSRGIVT